MVDNCTDFSKMEKYIQTKTFKRCSATESEAGSSQSHASTDSCKYYLLLFLLIN